MHTRARSLLKRITVTSCGLVVPLVAFLLLMIAGAWASTAPADFIVQNCGGTHSTNYTDVGFSFTSASLSAPGCSSSIGSRWFSTGTSFGPDHYAAFSFVPTVGGYYKVWLAWPTAAAQTNTAVNIYTGAHTGSAIADIWGNTGGPQGVIWSGTRSMYYNGNVWSACATVPMSTSTTYWVGLYAGYKTPYAGGATPADTSANRIVAGAAKFTFTGPAKANVQAPAMGATDVAPTAVQLSWTAGGATDTYDVYLGTNSAGLAKVSAAQAATTFSAGDLTRGVTYYWRVDSIYAGLKTTGDLWSFTTAAAADNHLLTLVSNSTDMGTCSGGGYLAAGSVNVSCSAKTNYHFVKWTSDAAGNNVISTSAAFAYSMPDADSTIYAWFEGNPVTFDLTASPAAGGSVAGAGTYAYNTPVTAIATPQPGYWFTYWTDSAGAIVSRKASYSFNIPVDAVSLIANFVKAKFAEDFEGLVRGTATSKGSLDMNYTTGDNKGDNGDKNSGNPWWGTGVPPYDYNLSAGIDPALAAAGVHSGLNCAWSGYAGNGCDYVNLAYRVNDGAPLVGNYYADWWFYDAWGSTRQLAAGNYCDDALSLTSGTSIPTGTDYPDTVHSANFTDADFAQKISLGMATDWCTITGTSGSQVFTDYLGYDHTKYQARIKASTASEPVPGRTSFGNGWYNTSATRTVGWHHARIVVGAVDQNSRNPVSFYIDDMSTPALAGTMTSGIKEMELVSEWKVGSSPSVVNWPDGVMYDDIVVGTPIAPPASPIAEAPVLISQNAIHWRWTQSGTADGFHVFDAAVGGSRKSGDLTSCAFDETGLAANTKYTRWVSAYNAPVKYDYFESPRVALLAAWTLAAPPVYGASGNAAVNCNMGETNLDASLSQVIRFSAVNGFGSGADKASKYRYIWDQNDTEPADWSQAAEWTAGALAFTPTQAGTYYLHLRSVNGAGAVTASTKLFGPYTFRSVVNVSKIGDLWPLDNGPKNVLSDKVVTGSTTGAFWVEETDRTAAVKVIYSEAVSAGHKVDIVGVLDSTGGQRVLRAISVEDKGIGQLIAPIFVVGKSAAGRGVNYNTPGALNGTGLYNVGMLVRMAGEIKGVSVSDPLNKFFYLDDGSGLMDGEDTGIKVLCGQYTPPSSGFKTVTGFIGVDSGKPVLIPRSMSDIEP